MTRKPLDTRRQRFSELRVRQWCTAETQHGEVAGQEAILEQVEQGGHQLALGQVARGAEDHERYGRRLPRSRCCAHVVAAVYGRNLRHMLAVCQRMASRNRTAADIHGPRPFRCGTYTVLTAKSETGRV